ncbi:hypothetical protein CROQUDRAFT_43556 [Cronartium quercuum f. sp. fusiforme G11]|uniref:HTH CENPB-type domain-containing protein n=1 Tax=Cronartium quercuum f. sp. fusiforme G11 TaxID=708437 RepID=A0A9P6NHB3_9BASI|nr:hypothetical protein CROQUDRAFT_43556 [Cronartium quercuum f. sp. fusiforme G11]
MIQTKAHHFSAILGIEMKLSNGWMTKFKKHYNICKVTLHGEALSVNPDDVASVHAELLEITKDYKPHNICNADESGLCYCMPPNKVLKAGVKGNKSQITYLLCANADRTHKLDPLVIGSSAKPKFIRGKPAHYYGFQYTFNKDAWMTRKIFGN